MSSIDAIGYNIVILVRKINPNMTNNETKLYFKILKSLSKDSFINKKEITHFLKQYLENPVLNTQQDITKYNKNIIDFAERMQKANHIIYDKNYLRKKAKGEGIMYSSLNVYASLTSDGLIFLNNYLDRKSNKRILYFQIIITVLTTIFIGFGFYYARLTYNHTIENDSLKRLKELNTQSQILKKTPPQETKKSPYQVTLNPKIHPIDSAKKK